ncbi:hypothetical protein CY35_14G094300 [Sphagnum magellanicum]|nr:hypothetical protein CY35_14G094300 [Sphagnum magellanicum]
MLHNTYMSMSMEKRISSRHQCVRKVVGAFGLISKLSLGTSLCMTKNLQVTRGGWVMEGERETVHRYVSGSPYCCFLETPNLSNFSWF